MVLALALFLARSAAASLQTLGAGLMVMEVVVQTSLADNLLTGSGNITAAARTWLPCRSLNSTVPLARSDGRS